MTCKFDSEEDKMKVNVMIKQSEEFFVGKTHEAYEPYKQEISENNLRQVPINRLSPRDINYFF